jgi:hypothetical protein
MSLLTLFSARSVITLTVAAVRVNDIAVPPVLNQGAVFLPVPAVAERLACVPPTVFTTIQRSVTPVLLTYLITEITINGNIEVTVDAAYTKISGVAPSTTTTITRTVAPVAGRYAAVSPEIQPEIFVSGVVLRLTAVTPTITGGGGVGLGVIPKRSGDN